MSQFHVKYTYHVLVLVGACLLHDSTTLWMVGLDTRHCSVAGYQAGCHLQSPIYIPAVNKQDVTSPGRMKIPAWPGRADMQPLIIHTYTQPANVLLWCKSKAELVYLSRYLDYIRSSSGLLISINTYILVISKPLHNSASPALRRRHLRVVWCECVRGQVRGVPCLSNTLTPHTHCHTIMGRHVTLSFSSLSSPLLKGKFELDSKALIYLVTLRFPLDFKYPMYLLFSATLILVNYNDEKQQLKIFLWYRFFKLMIVCPLTSAEPSSRRLPSVLQCRWKPR